VVPARMDGCPVALSTELGTCAVPRQFCICVCGCRLLPILPRAVAWARLPCPRAQRWCCEGALMAGGGSGEEDAGGTAKCHTRWPGGCATIGGCGRAERASRRPDHGAGVPGPRKGGRTCFVGVALGGAGRWWRSDRAQLAWSQTSGALAHPSLNTRALAHPGLLICVRVRIYALAHPFPHVGLGSPASTRGRWRPCL
jgi:hypothetical protein